MLDGIEAIFHPAFWIILVLGLIGAGFYGFGSNLADRAFGPNPEKVRQQCVQRAHGEKDRCLNGGFGGSVFKTKGRIKACDEIYPRDSKACG